MLDSKLSKIKALIEQKEKIDAELAVLIGDQDRPKRGRPSKKDAPTEAGASGGGS